MPATQKNRLLAIHIDGQKEELLLRSFSINEQMGRLYRMEVEMDSEETGINFEDIVRRNATVRLTMPNEESRYFCGIVTRFEQEQQGQVARYRATISPKLWRLTRTADCKIFQEETVPEIIKAVFEAHGMSNGDDFKLKITGTYSKREFCVQYRETAFNFVSRLMEQEGIFYFFTHDESGKHVMVLADSNSAFDPFPGYDDLTYRPATGKHEEQRESVTDWIVEKEIQTGKYAMTDYNFEKPSLSLLAKNNRATDSDLEVFDYPGGYALPADGDAYAKLRVQELQAQYEIIHAKTTARGVATGCTFTLKDHPRSDQEREYLVTSMSLEAKSGAYASGDAEEDEGEFFSCNFSAIPIKTSGSMPFRMPRTTPRPMIRGPQTAIVVGPSGEEIYTDEHGRVKLHFHWDRYDKKDDKSSCWVRVSQNWASAAWGSMHLPRLQDEVIVEFLEGDPDRPIVTGRVYHGTNVPPYTLPDQKTKSTIKSNSSKGGGGSNELRFEDKKGSEEVFIHAQKDQTINVENDENTSIGHDRTRKVGNDETINISNNQNITVGKDRTETVSENESITINGTRTETVAKDESITINGGRTETVAKDESISITGARSTDITKSETISVGDSRTETVAKDESITISGGRTVQITNNDEQNIGKKYALIAGDQIQLQTGEASITLKSDGTIEIKGAQIKVNGSDTITVKSSSDVVLKGESVATN